MAPPPPTEQIMPVNNGVPLLFAHPDVAVSDSLRWLVNHVGAIESAQSWAQLEHHASTAWPMIFIHEDMLTDPVAARSSLDRLRQYGSRLILVTHPDQKHGERLARAFNFNECIRWAPDHPFALVQCVNHTIEQAAVISQIVSQDHLFQRIQCGAMDGLWDWDIVASEMTVSDRFRALIGRSQESGTYRPSDWLRWLHPDDEPVFRAALRAHMRSKDPVFQRDARVSLPDGGFRWLRIRGALARDVNGQPIRMAGSVTDIQNQKNIWKQAAYEALHDPVTDLPNRSALIDRINRCLTRAKRRPQTFAVMHIDIERFGLMNKALGHTLGDILLKQIAHRIEEALLDQHTLARLDGGCFGVLLEAFENVKHVQDNVDAVQIAMKKPFQVGGLELYIHLRIGSTMGTSAHSGARALLGEAERVGESDSRTIRPPGDASPALTDKARALVALEADLHKAVENNSFELYYQPIISLGEDQTEAYEALIRWHHPTRGFVSPGQFIPLAEDTGLILPLGEWVLETAFAQAYTWHQEQPENPPRINVNVSAIQIQQSDLRAIVAKLFERYPLPKGVIRLEITETALMTEMDEHIQTLEALRNLGVDIQIDDFGTGYSSLSQLAQLPVDALKIDRSFVAKMESDPKSAAIVRTIAHLAHSLGLNVIAEGIETASQLSWVEDLNCTSAQGYFFSRPVVAHDARQWSIKNLTRGSSQSQTTAIP